jgi:HEAT repeat protein
MAKNRAPRIPCAAFFPIQASFLIVARKVAILLLLILPFAACGRYKARKELSRTHAFAEILQRESLRWIGEDKFFEDNLLTNENPEVSRWSAIALGRIADPRALPLLYGAIHSADASVRAASAFSIGQIEDRRRLDKRYLTPDPRAADEMRRLLDDTSISVRARAVEALGKIGSSADADEIARRLEHLPRLLSPYERQYLNLSITALARLNDPDTVPTLECLADSQDVETRWRALDALACLRSKTSSPLFAKNLQNPNFEVRSCAACGMGVVADSDQAGPLLPLLVPNRGKTDNAASLSVRICALQSLAMMKNPQTVRAIEAAIMSEPIDNAHPDQENFAIQAAAALGDIGTDESEQALLTLLNHPGPIADTTVIALAKIFRINPARFFQLMGKDHLKIAGSAWAQAMAELGGPEAAEQLNQMLKHAVSSDSPSERRALPEILSAMARMDTPLPQEIWMLLLRSRDCAVLPAALAAYQLPLAMNAPWTPAMDAFKTCESSGDVAARIEILSCLRPWIREKQVQQLLQTGLKDPERNVRFAAGTLLRKAAVPGIPEDPGPAGGAVT